MARRHLRPYWADPNRVQDPAGALRVISVGTLAGGVAALLFQHGTLFLLSSAGSKAPLLAVLVGATPAPFSLAPDQTIGIPLLVRDLRWGGLWSVVLAFAIGRGRLPAGVTGALLVGVVLATLYFASSALPYGRLPLVAAQDSIARTTLLYAAWGWGTAVLLRSIVRA